MGQVRQRFGLVNKLWGPSTNGRLKPKRKEVENIKQNCFQRLPLATLIDIVSSFSYEVTFTTHESSREKFPTIGLGGMRST